MFKPARIPRALSTFDPVGRYWATVPLCPPPPAPLIQTPKELPTSTSRPAQKYRLDIGRRLCLTSWNINASPGQLAERSELILDRILKGPKSSDIIFLQEVAPHVRQSLLANHSVRSSFLITDAEDDQSFKGVPFTTMTLLSKKRFVSPLLLTEEEGSAGEANSPMVLDDVFRMTLLSRCDRDALCVSIHDPTAPGRVLHLLNVHLELDDSWFRRAYQVLLLDCYLRQDRCNGGIMAGDFNPHHPHDYTLVEERGLLDAWQALPQSRIGPEGGVTWDGSFDGRKPRRSDKVVMLGLKPVNI